MSLAKRSCIFCAIAAFAVLLGGLVACGARRERAELFWESLLLADSSDMGTRVYMAMNLERMGRYDESFAMFELLLKQPESSGLDFAEIMNYYGYSLIDMNRSAADVDRGLALVQKALDKIGKTSAATPLSLRG